MSDTAATGSIFSSMSALAGWKNGKLALKGPAGIMFHHFHGGVHPRAQGSISGRDLKDLIEAAGPERILNIDVFVRRALEQTLPPDALCLTFDDNLLCQFDIALPVLREYGLVGLWNINTAPLVKNVDRLELYRHFRMNAFSEIDSFYEAYFQRLQATRYAGLVQDALKNLDVNAYLAEHSVYSPNDRVFRFVRDRVLTSDEYFALMDGMIIETVGYSISDAVNILWMKAKHLGVLIKEGHMLGLHTHNHPTSIASLSRDEQKREFEENRQILREQTGVTPNVMSHPNGSYSSDTLDILKDLGVKVAFRADPYMDNPTLLELPRYDHAELMTMLKNKA